MLAPLLLGMTLALPATGKIFFVQVDAGADVAYLTLGPDAGPTDSNATQGDAFAGITVAPLGIEDDEAPPALQGFLQRSFRFHVGGHGGGGALQATSTSAREDRSFGGANAWIEGYPHRNLFLNARLDIGANHDSLSLPGLPTMTSGTLTVSPQAAIGARFRDVLLFAGWGVDVLRPDQGTFYVAFYGGAFGGLSAVLDRNLWLNARARGVDGGASGDVTFTAYVQRRLFASVAAFLTRGTPSGATTSYTTAGGSVEFGAWLATRFGLSFAYGASWYGTNGRSQVQHLFTLTGFAR
jgi:hypothetical protein